MGGVRLVSRFWSQSRYGGIRKRQGHRRRKVGVAHFSTRKTDLQKQYTMRHRRLQDKFVLAIHPASNQFIYGPLRIGYNPAMRY